MGMAHHARYDLRLKSGDLPPAGEYRGAIEITTQWFFNPAAAGLGEAKAGANSDTESVCLYNGGKIFVEPLCRYYHRCGRSRIGQEQPCILVDRLCASRESANFPPPRALFFLFLKPNQEGKVRDNEIEESVYVFFAFTPESRLVFDILCRPLLWVARTFNDTHRTTAITYGFPLAPLVMLYWPPGHIGGGRRKPGGRSQQADRGEGGRPDGAGEEAEREGGAPCRAEGLQGETRQMQRHKAENKKQDN